MMMMVMVMPRAVAHGGDRGGRLVCGRRGVHVSTMQPALSAVAGVQRSGVVVAAPPPSCWCCCSCRVRDLLERQGHGVDDVHVAVGRVVVGASGLRLVDEHAHGERGEGGSSGRAAVAATAAASGAGSGGPVPALGAERSSVTAAAAPLSH